MQNNFRNKNIAVLGFGIEGESAVKFLFENKAYVSVFDIKEEKEFENWKITDLKKKGVKFYFGPFPESFSGFDIIVRSPGIKPDSKAIEQAQKDKVVITSPTKIFFDLCPSPIIGITGTKGKGTTSSLIYEMLKVQGLDVFLGGNIGVSPIDFLEKITDKSYVVLELSSFQLQDLQKSPHIAVLLMVTSEHLDYHKNIIDYVSAKRNILCYQKPSDFAILNRDYPASLESDICTEGRVFQVSREVEVREGCFIKDKAVWLKADGRLEKIINTEDMLLPGKHNWENICAAVMAAKIAKVSKQNIVKVLKSFKSLKHRLELVAIVSGVKYYDDSFSTTPETAEAAIETFLEPEILILGGSSKGSDFTHLGKIISEKQNIKAIIGIGAEWPKIKSKIKNEKLKIIDKEKHLGWCQAERKRSHDSSEVDEKKIVTIEGCKNMKEIAQAAFDAAQFGDIVLLSPACASFDMFKNYKDRGEQFKKEVKKLNTWD